MTATEALTAAPAPPDESLETVQLKTVIVIAHPDDETMLGYAAQKYPSIIVTATYGTATTLDYRRPKQREDFPDFIERGGRCGEARAAMKALGIRRRQIYLGLPDGELPDYQEKITRRLIRIAHSRNIGRFVT